jgi:hypothetical protein
MLDLRVEPDRRRLRWADLASPPTYAPGSGWTAWAGVAAIGVALGKVTEAAAVAELALIAPGWPDILDEVAGTIAHPRLPHPTHKSNWPRRATQLARLERARRVKLGDVALVGPDGVRLEQVTAVWSGGDGPTRHLLRLR